MNSSDMMGASQILGTILAQSQTNFNGLVQMTEADNVFKQNVYDQFKKVNNTLAMIVEKLGITDPVVPEEQAQVQTSKTKSK